MISMLLASSSVAAIRNRKARHQIAKLLIECPGLEPFLNVPHLVEQDDIAVPAPTVLRDTDLARADAFHAGGASHVEFWRSQVGNFFNEIHDDTPASQSSDRSLSYCCSFPASFRHCVTFLSYVNKKTRSWRKWNFSQPVVTKGCPRRGGGDPYLASGSPPPCARGWGWGPRAVGHSVGLTPADTLRAASFAWVRRPAFFFHSSRDTTLVRARCCERALSNAMSRIRSAW